jgi:hypothetical protein
MICRRYVCLGERYSGTNLRACKEHLLCPFGPQNVNTKQVFYLCGSGSVPRFRELPREGIYPFVFGRLGALRVRTRVSWNHRFHVYWRAQQKPRPIRMSCVLHNCLQYLPRYVTHSDYLRFSERVDRARRWALITSGAPINVPTK